MIVAWKYRTSFENAYDSFEKISKFHYYDAFMSSVGCI